MSTRRSRSRRDEDGLVLVWMAMVIILLLAVAALAVDLVHAYAVGQKAQNAADAAALAGAIQLPRGTPGCPGAQAQAAKLATNNGFTTNANDTVTATCTGANEMTVDIKSTFGTFFAKAIGFGTLAVHRHAVAQYDAGVRMGSPANNLGNVKYCPPIFGLNQCLSDPTNGVQNIWASVEGPASTKTNGNALTPHNCNDTSSTTPDDECNGVINNEEDLNGEFYSVHNDGVGPLDIWLYDAGYVPTQFDCGKPPQVGLSGLEAEWFDGNPDHMFAWQHYNDPEACSGDTQFAGDNLPFDTRYDLLAPGVPDNGPATCTTNWIKGFTWDDNIPQTATDRAYKDPSTAKDYFHQWRKLCGGSVPGAVVGDYRIRVQVQGPAGICSKGIPGGCGVNDFSILAAHNSGNQGGSQLAVFAPEKLPLVAITTANSTQDFYLARVLPSTHDRTLEVSFFDIGDPGKGTLDLTASADVNPLFTSALKTTIDMCRYIDPASSPPPNFFPFPSPDSDPPWTTLVGCQAKYDAQPTTVAPTTWNGRWVVMHIQLPKQSDPNGYDCNNGVTSTPQDCWIKLRITPSVNNHDATTWNAKILGAPARLTG